MPILKAIAQRQISPNLKAAVVGLGLNKWPTVSDRQRFQPIN
ncbi:hypothetical protein N507_0633 [Lacticaseibacillus rhamnosus DSM 14870]|nr:hypothetical protein N507_0633 [Lacticaseibacillus rhamnosus DSM 14870]